VPSFDGLDSFAGDAFHSSRWRHDVALEGRRVSVVGSAASAIQLVPAIADSVAGLNVLQRSPNWIVPKNDREYTRAERWLARRVPPVAWLYRLQVWLWGECMAYPALGRNRFAKWEGRRRHRRYLQRVVEDPALRAALVPDYPFGAKRVLLSDNYYQALVKPNVRLVTAPIARLTPDGIELAGGEVLDSDVIVFATGFRTTEFMAPMRVYGRGGLALEERWRDGAEAYLGVMTSGFPNFFMLYGPNTNLGHNSIVIMHECQSRLIVDCLRRMHRRGAGRMEVRAPVETRYNRRLADRLAHKAWASIASSWYQDRGRQTNNWPGTTLEYWWRTRRCSDSDYVFSA
ncbi:MAG: NAD(P)/FAD-dependent oxidoreductase, partial [Pseudomonadota bacterium]